MDRLVFINDNDAGSGNNSTFSNVRIYEGTCSASTAVLVSSFGTRIDQFGDEDEGVFTSIQVAPNPINKGSLLRVVGPNRNLENAKYSIINTLGQVVQKGELTSRSIDLNKLNSGIYVLRIENEKAKTNKRFIIK